VVAALRRLGGVAKVELENRRQQWVLLGLLALALGARVAYVATHSHLLAADTDDYARLADNLCKHGAFTFAPELNAPTAHRPVLYPLLLAGLQHVFGESVWPVAVLQILMGVVTTALVWHVARRAAGPWAAGAAGLMTAVDPLLVHSTALRMTETSSALFTALAMWAVLRISSTHTGRDGLVAGVILGLGALCRPIVWGWALLIVVLTKFRPDLSARARLAAMLLILAGFVGVQTPWLVRNWFELGRPVWTTTHGGYTFLLGNNPVFYCEVVAKPDVDLWPEDSFQAWTRMHEKKHMFMGEVERDRYLYDRAWAFIRGNPGAFLACSWLKFKRFWGLRPHAMHSPTLGWLVAVWYGAQLPLLAVGFAAGRGWRWPLVLLLAAILVFTLTHTFYWSNMRMRAPLAPALAVFAGIGAVWFVRKIRKTSPVRVASPSPSGLGGLPVAGATSLDE
jgi:4-amino-4-deoxy-L-arabinose transferase-like glycosyltransferase